MHKVKKTHISKQIIQGDFNLVIYIYIKLKYMEVWIVMVKSGWSILDSFYLCFLILCNEHTLMVQLIRTIIRKRSKAFSLSMYSHIKHQIVEKGF